MKLKTGFTLIELLVVIAIIAILAAIIFPVYARVKDSAYRGSDMSNLNSIRTALQLYRTDQGAYPPALLGYATGYANFTPQVTDIVPATLVAQATPNFQNSAFMFPKRVNSLETLRPAYDRSANTLFTKAVWPQGIAPQRYGPNDGFVSRCIDFNDGSGPNLQTNYYYNVSGYDVGDAMVPGTNNHRSELRYAPFWSKDTVPATCAPPDVSGSASDSPRQLGYSDPPETTVVTWDSYFREYGANGTLTHNGKRDIVLFLGGEARPMDSLDVSNQAWQVNP
jgi:prepilin-type N-terminal cleavage/methylation domain-containing protein